MVEDPEILEIKTNKVAHVMCKQTFMFFVRYFFKSQYKRKYSKWDHLYQIAEVLEKVLNGEITRLIINIAPRYGKTELAVKLFIAYGLALNAAAKFIHISYSDELALDNSEAAKDVVNSEDYQKLFPNVKLSTSSKAKKKWYTTDGGGVYAAASGGQITGFGAGLVDEEEEDTKEFIEALNEIIEQNNISWLGNKSNFGGAIIIDDPNKPDDADSETLRKRVNDRFDSTISNRVNSRHTPIIIIQQRTHEDDLSGYLLRKQKSVDEGGVWHVLSLPSIKEDGTALCPAKHTIEELKALKEHNEIVFERQHMQNPKPIAGLLFAKEKLSFVNFDDIPGLADADDIYIPADPANLGGDDFAAGDFRLVGDKIYLNSVIYNTLGTDHNEVALVKLIHQSNARSVGVEGVMGWAETAQRIREELERKNYEGEFRVLRPRKSKHSRILSRSSFIINNFVFREDYEDYPEYAKFMRILTSYLKIQEAGRGNKHDDAPDLCEMAAGYYEKNHSHLFGMNKN